MLGGAGDDTYHADSAGDVIFEYPDQGADVVEASVDFILPLDVEFLTLVGSARSGTGNSQSNFLVGNAYGNVLNGEGGGDFLLGEDGEDTLLGGDGNDNLDGGNGADSMSGGAGDDVYEVGMTADLVVESAGGGTDRERCARSRSPGRPDRRPRRSPSLRRRTSCRRQRGHPGC
jgi:Ca2+-binding RTX toxin-like protein